jgi:alpha-beta hydrolase superfamily lysophospholipase
MRNLKKLLAVIVSICVLASFTVPAFAAGSNTYETQAQGLYEMKLYQGSGHEVLNESSKREAYTDILEFLDDVIAKRGGTK